MNRPYENEDKTLVAVDCIIFGFDQEKLKLLLIKRDFEPEKGNWSLMGGFLKMDETVDQAAVRVLKTLTGLHEVFMEQLRVFSEINRDPVQRTISVAYYALINIQDHNKELIKKYSAEWFELSKKPKLIFDHDSMVREAIDHLRIETSLRPAGFELLPEKFTMRQLQKLYEAILGQKLDKRNFIKKINSLDILNKLDEKDMSSSKKGSYLFRFDQAKYYRKNGLFGSGSKLNW